MELAHKDIIPLMNLFLQEAKHSTWFGVFKDERDVKNRKFSLRADSFTGNCRVTYGNYIILYNSNTGAINTINTSTDSESNEQESTDDIIENETKGTALEEPYSTLITISFYITKKGDEPTWKVMLIKFVRKITGAFVDETGRGIIGLFFGALLTLITALFYQWLSVDHGTQDIRLIPIENLCINYMICSHEAMPEANLKGRPFSPVPY